MPVPPKSVAGTPTSSDQIVGSASTSGQMIAIAGTSAGTATLLHSVPRGVGDFQRIDVWAVNIDTVERTLTTCWGAVATKDQIPQKIGPQRGLVKVVSGLKLYRGQEVRAFGSATNIFNCYVGVGRRDNNP